MTTGFRMRPVFRGDGWGELREAQAAARQETLEDFGGRMSDLYLRSALIVDCESDRIAEALRAGPFFDMRSLLPHHDYMAGFWRWKHGHLHQPLPGIVRTEPLVAEWRRWFDSAAMLWFFDHPHLVRLAARVLAESLVQHVGTIAAEAEFWEALREAYPVPPPEQPDFFDDQARVA